MSAKVLICSVEKGGAGKSTESNNLAYDLSFKGKTLLIDFDSQADQTKGFLGYLDNYTGDSSHNIRIIENDLEPELIEVSDVNNLYFLPANRELLDFAESCIEDKNYKLLNYINKIKEEFDYIVIDCPPSFGTLTKNAVLCANSIIVPVQTNTIDSYGMIDYFRLLDNFLSNEKHSIENIFILPTMYTATNNDDKYSLLSIKTKTMRFLKRLENLKKINHQLLPEVPRRVAIKTASAQNMFLREYIKEYKLNNELVVIREKILLLLEEHKAA